MGSVIHKIHFWKIAALVIVRSISISEGKSKQLLVLQKLSVERNS